MRGNLLLRRLGRRSKRSIPACAGEPYRLRKGGCVYGVYPRVCGGTTPSPHTGWLAMGLSPRVRGNLFRLTGLRDRQRSIPACAGEPIQQNMSEVRTRVYPRVCGGTPAASSRGRKAKGLSPRVRGNPPRDHPAADCERSIPACAGEPYCHQNSSALIKVYPRVCGGTSPTPPRIWHPRGLSPRVRGNPARRPGAGGGPRSIPECAGEPGGRR